MKLKRFSERTTNNRPNCDDNKYEHRDEDPNESTALHLPLHFSYMRLQGALSDVRGAKLAAKKRLLVAAPDLFKIEDETIHGAPACNGRPGLHARLAALGVNVNLLRIGVDQPA